MRKKPRKSTAKSRPSKVAKPQIVEKPLGEESPAPGCDTLRVDTTQLTPTEREYVLVPRSDVSKPKPPVEIPVVDCCGVFGYLIPWSQWKTRTLPIVPTRDMERVAIYLYSEAGQLRALRAERRYNAPFVCPPPTGNSLNAGCLTVNLDVFVSPETLSVQWDRVAESITRNWHSYLTPVKENRVGQF